MNLNLVEAKKCYIDAVFNSLARNYQLSHDISNKLMEAYRLYRLLELYPAEQLHYDVDETADEIVERGYQLGLIAKA